jgi:hypothetical protein
MILGIQGSAEFNDYSVFLSSMGLALKRMDAVDPDDNVFTIFSVGPKRVSEMAMEFVNVSNFKSRGISAKVVRVPESWAKDNSHDLDLFLYFCNERQPLSKLCDVLDKKEVDVQVMRYRTVK